MLQLRVYVDSSVWNASFDLHATEIRTQTLEFFARSLKLETVKLYISDVTLLEFSSAPPDRQRELAELLRAHTPVRLLADAEALSLADAYIEHGVLTAGHRVDAQHVALATRAGLDVLASWNYRHLVNRRRRDAFNGINALRGYKAIEIISPPEVFDE